MRYLILFLGLFGLFMNANAGTVTITAENGVRYILDLDNHTAEVTFKSGFSRSNTSSNYTLTDIVIPENITYQEEEYLVTSIGKDAFYNCMKLQQIKVPDTIVSIGEYAFYQCNNLVAFDFPEELTSIGKAAFCWCSKIERLVFPLKLKELPEIGFEYFYALNYLVIPPGITFIGNNCFYTPATISDKVICLNPTPVELDGYNVFSPQVWNGSKIYVPAGSVNDYKKLNGWNKARNLLPLTEASGIFINGEENTVKVGQQIQLSVSLLPEDVTCDIVEWKVENPEIAKISQKGIVTGIAPGQTNIIAVTLDGSNLTAEYPINVIEDKKIILGDSNDNEVVTVADVVTTANYIVGKPILSWSFINADVTCDNAITVADVTATVDIILNDADFLSMRGAKAYSAEAVSDRLISDSYVSGEPQAMIAVRLEDSKPYSAMQATIRVPDGMKIQDIAAGPRLTDHMVLFNEPAKDIVKIIIFSFYNSEFSADEAPLFYILADTRAASGNIQMVDILCSDASSNEYELGYEGGADESLTTGVGAIAGDRIMFRTVAEGIEVLNAEGIPVNVYTIRGETFVSVVPMAQSHKINLAAGMYIVKAASTTTKVIVK